MAGPTPEKKIWRRVLGTNATAFLTNVYDFSPRTFGTFDLVVLFGVLYDLRHPLLALEKIASVCSGTVLLQTADFKSAAVEDIAVAKFHPFGAQSGPPDSPMYDPSVF